MKKWWLKKAKLFFHKKSYAWLTDFHLFQIFYQNLNISLLKICLEMSQFFDLVDDSDEITFEIFFDYYLVEMWQNCLLNFLN